MTTETTNARPTHRIFAVTKSGKKKFWLHTTTIATTRYDRLRPPATIVCDQ